MDASHTKTGNPCFRLVGIPKGEIMCHEAAVTTTRPHPHSLLLAVLAYAARLLVCCSQRPWWFCKLLQIGHTVEALNHASNHSDGRIIGFSAAHRLPSGNSQPAY